MLRSGRPACGPVSLLAQESGRPQLRPESALLFSGWPHDLFGLVLFRKGTHVQKGVKKESFDPDDKGARIRVPERKDVRMDINFFGQGAELRQSNRHPPRNQGIFCASGRSACVGS